MVKDFYQKHKYEQSYPKEWNKEDHTQADQITDSYGECRFVDSKGKISKVEFYFKLFMQKFLSQFYSLNHVSF
jgi:hypothetical protein